MYTLLYKMCAPCAHVTEIASSEAPPQTNGLYVGGKSGASQIRNPKHEIQNKSKTENTNVQKDIKPAKVFLCAGGDDMVKLLDFGIAKDTGGTQLVQSEATTTGQLLGSPQYLSPEQARGQPVDARSDLWSVAVVLFRALTGKHPFEANDMGDLIAGVPRLGPQNPDPFAKTVDQQLLSEQLALPADPLPPDATDNTDTIVNGQSSSARAATSSGTMTDSGWTATRTAR